MEKKLPAAEVEATFTELRVAEILGVNYKPMDPIPGVVLNLG